MKYSIMEVCLIQRKEHTMNELVEIRKNQVVTSSRQVAQVFGKLHKDVLENIRGILSAENSANKFFCKTSYTYRGRTLPEYLMNRDGFSLLVMGFTGKKALEWKIKYIEAFNAMEKALREQSAPALPENPDRRYTLRGVPVMTSMQLEKLLHVVHEELLRRVKQYGLPYFLLQGKMLGQFKRENRICDSRASSMAVYMKETVYELARLFGCLASIRQTLEAYFSAARGEALDIRAKILQLYTLRSTIGYVKDWEKRRIVAEYIVDEMMRLGLWTPPAGRTDPEDMLNINSANGWSLDGAVHIAHMLIQQGREVTKKNMDLLQADINKSVGIG